MKTRPLNSATVDRRCNPVVIIKFSKRKRSTGGKVLLVFTFIITSGMLNSYARSQSPPACLVPLILIGFRAPLHVLFTNTSYFRAILNTVNEWSSKHYEYWVRSGLYFFCLYADVSRCLSFSRKLRKKFSR